MGKETQCTIRPLTEKDLLWLLPMDEASFPEPWSLTTWEDELDGRLSHYIAVEQAGQPVAYGGFWLVAGEAQVMRLAVTPEKRGQKLGLFLVNAMLQEAKKLQATEMTLEVRAGNLPALGTYRHLGFAPNGRRPHYYTDNGEDAILMRREL
jgi:ribosomal-protein-alanine acetyltransferase